MSIKITGAILKEIVPSLNANDAEAWATVAAEVFPHYEITTPIRIAAFLGNAVIESQYFTALSENMNYSKPERIASIFRSTMDLDKDKVIDPEEIENAKKYVRNPELLANTVYANKYGNGDIASGDGFRFRGGGIMHITFKDMFVEYAEFVGMELGYVARAVRTDKFYALDSGAWCWHVVKGINPIADKGDFKKCVARINPAFVGYNERLGVYEKAKIVLGVK